MKRIRPKEKVALRKKKDILPQGEKFACARREISVRTKKYFRAHENLFSSARKFQPLRKEAYPPTQ